ncbi:hypothetical protein G3545_19830 [Starkeya sp. ORNL1]|uniref:hypothetical protein n=1 Tax=Starkeya sp. ORNL1 TaxID=2709380 RepID=UPI001463A443|nr:hypothetical protein [Starkeya sp. ORNL1]QJP15707.1 hypothetical protein G3545_19830 [Starkeya sp. ORNL1]
MFWAARDRNCHQSTCLPSGWAAPVEGGSLVAAGHFSRALDPGRRTSGKREGLLTHFWRRERERCTSVVQKCLTWGNSLEYRRHRDSCLDELEASRLAGADAQCWNWLSHSAIQRKQVDYPEKGIARKIPTKISWDAVIINLHHASPWAGLIDTWHCPRQRKPHRAIS